MNLDLKTLSFPEKVIWVNLITTVLLMGYYLITVITQNLDGGAAAWLYLKVVFWVIVIEIVVISILAAREKRQKGDERDKIIETRGYKWGYFVMLTGLIAALWQTAVRAIGDSLVDHPEMSEGVAQFLVKLSEHSSPFLIIHIMLITLVLAEITKASAQLFYYRRGF